MVKKIQEVYVNLDDSGKLNYNDKICVYAGLVFLSKTEKDKFITQYRKIISEIKNKYKTENGYKEIKNTSILPTDKRRIMNYLKKYIKVVVILNNENVFKPIMDSKASRGRFIDYAIKRLIKEIIKRLITEKQIDPYFPLKLIINIDQQTTKSNGYYNLKDSLYEELKVGIYNYNYSSKIDPIVFGDLTIQVSYQNSEKSYVIQGADLLAGTIRSWALDNIDDIEKELNRLVDYYVILP